MTINASRQKSPGPGSAARGDRVHVVVGGLGAVGRAVVCELLDRRLTVRVVTRTPRVLADDPRVPLFVGDIRDEQLARDVCRDAAVVYHCAGLPLTGDWSRELPRLMNGVIAGAREAAARIVYADNLLMYRPGQAPLTEQQPWDAPGSLGRARAAVARQLLAVAARGDVRAVIGRASDLFGPHVRESFAGHRLFGAALSGRAASLVGDPDQLHTYTYVTDFARALVELGQRREAAGETWHVPSAGPITTRQFAKTIYEQIGLPLRLRVAPPRMVSALALFSPTMRRVRQLIGQFSQPFLVDHGKYRAAFGATTTPHERAIRSTLDWYSRSCPNTRAMAPLQQGELR